MSCFPTTAWPSWPSRASIERVIQGAQEQLVEFWRGDISACEQRGPQQNPLRYTFVAESALREGGVQ
jgi:hypothetical protein